MAISIILVDDHRMFREGLRVLIERKDHLRVVAEADEGRGAVRLAEDLDPDVVVMDVSMPGLNGFEATRQIVERSPRIRVIALSMHCDEPFIGEMLSAGASGYLLKDCAFEELTEAIERVKDGHVYLSQHIEERVIQDYVSRYAGTQDSEVARLTSREREVVQLLAEGMNVKEIADTLFVSAKTVETHRNRIMKKLDITTIAGLTKWAIKAGLTAL